MKRNLIILSLLIIFQSCGVIKINENYSGIYNGKWINVEFKNFNTGEIRIEDNNIIPFKYKIEKANIKQGNTGKKVKMYIYRFTINAEYFDKDFPVGFYKIGNKKGKILTNGNGISLVRK